LTRDYLRALWGPTDISFVLGGGNEGVEAIVRSFQEEGASKVLGVTDRDYRPSNRDKWGDPNKTFRTFVLPAHEIENYLLEAEAIHASVYHNRGLTVEQIESHMLDKASRLCWWAACRESIAELKRRFREPFLPNPKQTIVDELGARKHICDSPWFQKLPTEAARSTETHIHQLLADEFHQAEQRLNSGDWCKDFSGKEIYHDVAGWICDETKLPFRKPRLEFFNDIAKEIADWQVANGRVPPDLSDLLEALRGRLGI
jgi:hypothetical protein